MIEELKQVQEYFPEAEIEIFQKVIRIGSCSECLFVEKQDDRYFLYASDFYRNETEYDICLSKDFNKILAVLKAIKLCEE